LSEDGSVPRDNPFVGQASIVRKSIPGVTATRRLAFRCAEWPALRDGTRPARRRRTEHHRGGQELWLARDHLRHGLFGAYVSPYTQRQGLEQPLILLDAVDRALGLAMYRGDKFPAWKAICSWGPWHSGICGASISTSAESRGSGAILERLHWAHPRCARGAGRISLRMHGRRGRTRVRLEPAN